MKRKALAQFSPPFSRELQVSFSPISSLLVGLPPLLRSPLMCKKKERVRHNLVIEVLSLHCPQSPFPPFAGDIEEKSGMNPIDGVDH